VKDERVLVADVGSLHCRIALARRDAYRPQLESHRLYAAPRTDLVDVLREYLLDARCEQPAAIAVAAAGRVRRLPGRTWVSVTHTSLTLERESLSNLCGGPCWIANERAAIAAALPLLSSDERWCFGPARAAVEGLRLVVSVGSGFGVAALTADETVIETEAGHADVAAVSAEERQWLNRLAPLGRLTADALLSESGLLRLYEVISGQSCQAVDELLLRLRKHENAALKTLTAFSTWLGRSTGNIVLSLGGWGGVDLTGSLVGNLGDSLDLHAFRRGFEDKAPFSADLAAVPVYRIAHAHPALLGMARIAFEKR
jgi:glucokinase